MSADVAWTVPPQIRENIGIYQCPRCGGALAVSATGQSLEAQCCGAVYTADDYTLKLFVPNDPEKSPKDVTVKVKNFYETTPFPNYDDMDSLDSLVRKSDKLLFSRLLFKQIAPGARVLEVGCGTGQLSNYLGSAGDKSVFGVDMCDNSLKLAETFRAKAGSDNVAFASMNLFRPAFREQVFDVVICSGVLHHTGDPFGGFKSVARLLKPGGHIVVGLYNLFGRFPLHVRRLIFNLTGDRFLGLDQRLRDISLSQKKKIHGLRININILTRVPILWTKCFAGSRRQGLVLSAVCPV